MPEGPFCQIGAQLFLSQKALLLQGTNCVFYLDPFSHRIAKSNIGMTIFQLLPIL